MSTPREPAAGEPDAVREIALQDVVAVPAAPPSAVESAAPRRRSTKRVWILLGSILGVLALLGGAAAVYFFVLTDPRPAPGDTVLAYDRAYGDIDCDLYFSITTRDFQRGLAETCEEFEETARDFVDGFASYDVEVTSTTIEGDRAEVATQETWELQGQENSADYVYSLVFVDGAWRIDALL